MENISSRLVRGLDSELVGDRVDSHRPPCVLGPGSVYSSGPGLFEPGSLSDDVDDDTDDVARNRDLGTLQVLSHLSALETVCSFSSVSDSRNVS